MNAKKQPAPKKADLSLNTWVKLARAFSTLNRKSVDNLRTFNVTQPQFLVMEALGHLGPLKVGELCDKMLVSGGNMTLVLDNLEKLGYIERVHNKEDRRSLIIQLTPEGKKTFSKVFPKHADYIGKMLGHLTNDEQKELGRMLKKVGIAVRDMKD